MPATTRIVITGGPGSGKTEFLERLKVEAELAGFVFLDELARQILTEQPELRHQRQELHREIYSRQVAREAAAGDQPLITDRGTIDAFAFHPETMKDVGTTLEAEYKRYSMVVQLGSAAALGALYYVKDEIRRESESEALIIEATLRKVYQAHPAYHFIPAEPQIEEKYSRFRRLIVSNIRA